MEPCIATTCNEHLLPGGFHTRHVEEHTRIHTGLPAHWRWCVEDGFVRVIAVLAILPGDSA